MFNIYDGRESFYQWDIDRKLIVNDNTINQVHFCNRTDSCSLVCEVYEENGKRLVNVPNILLQDDWRINVYGYDKNYTKHCAVYDVVKRTKPADYVYTETEVFTYQLLEDRIELLEEKGVSDEKIGEAVEKYLEENNVNVDLSEYYTKTETDNAIKEAVENIDIPETDLSEYAKKEDIPDTTGFITNTEVEASVESALEEAKASGAFKGEPGKDGEPGADYVLTETDKTEIAGEAAALVDVSGKANIETVPNSAEINTDNELVIQHNDTELFKVALPAGGGETEVTTYKDVSPVPLTQGAQYVFYASGTGTITVNFPGGKWGAGKITITLEEAGICKWYMWVQTADNAGSFISVAGARHYIEFDSTVPEAISVSSTCDTFVVIKLG